MEIGEELRDLLNEARAPSAAGAGEQDTGVGAAVTGRDSESGESRFMAARLLVSILASSHLLQSNNF